jgi:hypothetical protein
LKYVMRRFGEHPPTGPCASARAFYRLRGELQETCGISRRNIRPDNRIGDLMPTDAMRSKWKGIARRLRLPVPRFDVFHPFVVRFPPPQSKIRDLIHASGPASYLHSDGSVDPDAVWRCIKEIVAEQAGVSIDELRPETHYIHVLRPILYFRSNALNPA